MNKIIAYCGIKCDTKVEIEVLAKKIKIIEISPSAPDALLLIEELSNYLKVLTGDSGKSSFDPNDVTSARSLFVVAYNEEDEAIGCGAIRPINENVAEVKRMFAKTKSRGVGSQIIGYLEAQAKKLGYSALWLETRLINEKAISFYEKRGYSPIPNYGKYANNSKAICFEKNIYAEKLKPNFIVQN